MRRIQAVLLLAVTSMGLVVLCSPAGAQTVTCASFRTQPEAQAYYTANPSETNLDADRDGVACEHLPGSSSQPQSGTVSVTCANFRAQPEAQAYYASNPSATNLDADRDGVACEELPGGSGVSTVTQPVVTGQCHPSYSGACVPANVSDVDCAGGSGNGPAYVAERNFTVVGTDVYGLDADGDRLACEDPRADDRESLGTVPAGGTPALVTTPVVATPVSPAVQTVPALVVQQPVASSVAPAAAVRVDRAVRQPALTGTDSLGVSALGLGALGLGWMAVMLARLRGTPRY